MRRGPLVLVLALGCADPVGGSQAALVASATSCSSCDPSCSVARDAPESSDLTSARSSTLEYDARTGGVALEGDRPITPPIVDSDGDGVPDDADDCPGPGAFRAADGSCYGARFFFHALPFGGAAASDPLDLAIQVRTADVFFLMDTTGSMGGEIDTLRTGLTTGTLIAGCSGGIIGATRCTIPDAWFGVGRFDDYPSTPYGTPGLDWVYRTVQPITESVPTTQSAVNTLGLHNGWDLPESNGQALWAVATGGALGPHLTAQTGCAAGRWGHPCFRAGAIPIIVHFTDAPFHNGPNGYDYGSVLGSSAVFPSPTAVAHNDDLTSAHSVGDLAGRVVSYSGDTCALTNRIGGTRTCSSYNSTLGDAVFTFTLSRRTTVLLTLDGTTSTYPTITLLNTSGTSLQCEASWYTAGATIEGTLDAGRYYAVVENYDRYCGSYRINLADRASLPTTTSSFPVSWSTAVGAMTAKGIRVITVFSGPSSDQPDSDALANATGSISGTGRRYVFPISSSGVGLSTAVVDAIADLANYSRMDVTVRAADNPSTTFDERGFLESVTALGWGRGGCASISGGTTLVQCLPGTETRFRVTFRNGVVPPTSSNQVFDFYMEIVGDGLYVLERVPVRILVPAVVATVAPEGRYWREYDAM
ncbi:MAG: hypothetical protein AB7P00_28955 [Sandaracinaceae bacterium]